MAGVGREVEDEVEELVRVDRGTWLGGRATVGVEVEEERWDCDECDGMEEGCGVAVVPDLCLVGGLEVLLSGRFLRLERVGVEYWVGMVDDRMGKSER